MSAALPFALRTRFQALMEEGLSARGAAARLKISASTGARWARMLRDEGDVSALPQGRPIGSSKLDPFAQFFEELLAQDGDMTTTELAGAHQGCLWCHGTRGFNRPLHGQAGIYA